MPDPLPDFEPVLIAALGYFGRGDHRERARDLAIERRRSARTLEVSLDVVRGGGLRRSSRASARLR